MARYASPLTATLAANACLSTKKDNIPDNPCHLFENKNSTTGSTNVYKKILNGSAIQEVIIMI